MGWWDDASANGLQITRPPRARAIRRAGELLKQIEPATGQNNQYVKEAGARPLHSRTDAARDAGMSPDGQAGGAGAAFQVMEARSLALMKRHLAGEELTTADLESIRAPVDQGA